MAISALLQDERFGGCIHQPARPLRDGMRPAARTLLLTGDFFHDPADCKPLRGAGIASDISIIEASDRLAVGSVISFHACHPVALCGRSIDEMRWSGAAT